MKVSKPIQKWIYFAIFGLAVIFFIYALGFFTTLYDVTTGNGGGEAAAVFNAEGEAQTFNKTIMRLSFYGVILTAILLLMDNHKRKNFFVSNLVASLISSLFFISVSIYVIINVLNFKTYYLQVNFDFIAIIRGVPEVTPDPSVFNQGVVLSILMILVSLAVSFVGYTKYVETKRRFEARRLLKEGDK